MYEIKYDKICVAKEIVQALDKENNRTTFKIIERDLIEGYKSFKFVVQAIPKGDITGMHWILENEKMNKDISPPIKILEFVIHMSENLDDHLIEA